jgi:flagellar biosynthetic protein FlhB
VPRPEQTEKPTPKRQREARERGQVARSPDLSGAAIFLAIAVALHAIFLATFASSMHGVAVTFVHAGDPGEPTIRSVWGLFTRMGMSFIGLLLMVFIAALVVGVATNLLQFGFLFAPKLLIPNFGKLNPLEGFKRILFSKQTLVNLFKQFAKLSVVVLIVYLGVKDHIASFYALAHASPQDILLNVEAMLYNIALQFGVLLVVLGIADYIWARRQLEDSLKMSKQEVKDEHRQSEGNPEARGAMKQRQRAAARRRMMAAVPKATVVVTNPTHFAIALQWDELTMEAPVLTAKGADLLAMRIREVAREHNIPILENPPLARTLYDKVPLDSPIPPNLYAAVAQVIAFVYKLKNRTIA